MTRKQRRALLAFVAVVAIAVIALVWAMGTPAPEAPRTEEPAVIDPPRATTDRAPASAVTDGVETTESSRPSTLVAGDAGHEAPTASSVEKRGPEPRMESLAGSEHYALPDPERERQAREAISREVFGDEGPTRCETVCDCADGEGCDTGAGLCVPGLFSGPCCLDARCPSGSACTNPDGSPGLCP